MTIETKYNIGDKPFCMYGDAVFNNAITGVRVVELKEGKATTEYRIIGSIHTPSVDHVWIYEKKLFATKEELLQSL